MISEASFTMSIRGRGWAPCWRGPERAPAQRTRQLHPIRWRASANSPRSHCCQEPEVSAGDVSTG